VKHLKVLLFVIVLALLVSALPVMSVSAAPLAAGGTSSLSENYHIPPGESVIHWSHDQKIQNR